MRTVSRITIAGALVVTLALALSAAVATPEVTISNANNSLVVTPVDLEEMLEIPSAITGSAFDATGITSVSVTLVSGLDDSTVVLPTTLTGPDEDGFYTFRADVSEVAKGPYNATATATAGDTSTNTSDSVSLVIV